jgi:hypothetical protein
MIIVVRIVRSLFILIFTAQGSRRGYERDHRLQLFLRVFVRNYNGPDQLDMSVIPYFRLSML